MAKQKRRIRRQPSTYERIAAKLERERRAAPKQEIILRDNRAAADQTSALMFSGTEQPFNARNIAQAERENANLSTCTRVISGVISELPIYVAEKYMSPSGTTEWIPVPDHEVVTLLQQPNPQHDQTHITEHIVQSLLFTGNSFHGLERLPGIAGVGEMFPLETWKMRVVPNKRTGMTDHYEYGETYNNVRYNLDELLHIQLYNHTNFWWGRPRIEAARNQVLSDHHMDKTNEQFFRDGASIDSVFAPEADLTEDQIRMMRQNIAEKHRGFEKAHGMFIPPFAGKLYSFGASMQEMQFIDGLRMNREKEYALMGVPPFLGGVMEYANYANADIQESSFWRHTIKPFLRLIMNAVTRQIIWRHYEDDLYLRFDLSAVEALQQDDVKKAQKYSILVSGGIYTANEARSEGYQKEPHEDGDKLKGGGEMPFALQPSNTPPKEEKDATHIAVMHNFERKAFAGESTFEGKVRKYWKAQYKRILDALQEATGGGKAMSLLGPHITRDPLTGKTPVNWMDTKAEKEALATFIHATIEGLTERNGEAAIAELGIAGSFDASLPDVIHFIQTLTNNFAEDITDATFAKIQKLLTNAYKNESTWQQLSRELRETFRQFDRVRANTVARTEMGKIVNGASVQAYKQNDITHLEWWATLDDRTRDSHASVHRFKIKIGDIFPNGLAYPHDPGAPASEVCNCRCAVTGITNDDPNADLNDYSGNGNGHKRTATIQRELHGDRVICHTSDLNDPSPYVKRWTE